MVKECYELSLSRDYVSSWGLVESVRELIQNAIDQGDYEVYFDNNDLHIKNYNGIISVDTLILGNTSKLYDNSKIGQFGEGYKLAMLVLTRMGFDVILHNGPVDWIPCFKVSDTFGCEVLCIDCVENKNCNNVEFVISGMTNSQVAEIVDSFPLLFENTLPYNVVETEFGSIIIDPALKGKFFVQSLPIFEDNSFKYAYNFNADVVKLDRDRKSVNIYELKKIAANMILATKDFDLITKEITKSGTSDAEYIRSKKVDISDAIFQDYQEYLIDKYEVSKDSVIITKDDESVKRELKAMGEDDNIIEVPNTLIKGILNTNRDISVLNEATMKSTKHSNIEQVYWDMTYELSESVIELVVKYHDRLPKDFIEDFLQVLDNHVSNFELVRDEVKEGIESGDFNIRERNGR